MLTSPIISIITINYNNGEGLGRTLHSVVNQTWKEFEYIVIDGGSTDGSKEIIEEYSKDIDYWISEPDMGIYNAMNKGILASKGNYLLFINSGDELFDLNVLDKNIEYIHTEDLIYFDIYLIFSDKEKYHYYPESINFRTFIEGSIGHPTTFIKRDLFKRIGYYDETLHIVADWKFFLEAIVKFNCSRKKVNAVFSKFYMDGISSINEGQVDKERRRVLSKGFWMHLRYYEIGILVNNVKNTDPRIFIKKIIKKIL